VDEFGNFTFLAETPAIGRMRYSRKGTYLKSESTSNSLALSGKGVNQSGKYSFRTSGKETVKVKGDDISYSGGFVQKTKMIIAGEKASDTWPVAVPDSAVAPLRIRGRAPVVRQCSRSHPSPVRVGLVRASSWLASLMWSRDRPLLDVRRVALVFRIASRGPPAYLKGNAKTWPCQSFVHDK
jgi:hypothetical protein